MYKDSRIFLCNSVGADVSMVKLLGLMMWSLESECCLIEVLRICKMEACSERKFPMVTYSLVKVKGRMTCVGGCTSTTRKFLKTIKRKKETEEKRRQRR